MLWSNQHFIHFHHNLPAFIFYAAAAEGRYPTCRFNHLIYLSCCLQGSSYMRPTFILVLCTSSHSPVRCVFPCPVSPPKCIASHFSGLNSIYPSDQPARFLGTVAQWLALLPHSARDVWSIPGLSHCLWSLHIFPVSAWVSSGCSSFLPHSKDVWVRWIGHVKWPFVSGSLARVNEWCYGDRALV